MTIFGYLKPVLKQILNQQQNQLKQSTVRGMDGN